MSRGKALSDQEKGQILVQSHHGLSIRQIAQELKRSRDAISRFLSRPHPSQQKVWKPRNKKITAQTERRIIREAYETKQSSDEIRIDLHLPITTKRVQQILSSCTHIEYRKAIKAFLLLQRHKFAWLDWSKKFLQWNAMDWKKVIFCDENKFNLDGPDGHAYYWHDLRSDDDVFSKRQQGSESIMVWGDVSCFGQSDFHGIKTNMNSQNYCSVLEESLLLFAANALGENWVYQLDNAPVHISNYTSNWLANHNISTLEWPARSPDLNIIENVWGYMVRSVHKHGRQLNNVEDLANAITDAWVDLNVNYIQNLYKFIPRRSSP